MNPFVSRALLFLTVFISLSTLISCGGQPALEQTQTAVKADTPEVPINSAVKKGWQASTAGSKENPLDFKPHIEGDEIFVASRSGKINGISIETGKTIFSEKLDASLVSGVGTNLSTIFAATTSGEVIALDREDGTEKWRYAVGRSISSAPVGSDQSVIIRTIDGKIIALDQLSGEQIWALERPVASLSVGLDAPSLVAGGGVVTGFSSGRVLACNVSTGQIFWEKRAFRPAGKNEIDRLIDIDATPVLAGQVAIVGAMKGGLIAYLLKNGEALWRNSEAGTRKNIAVHEQHIAVTQPASLVSLLDINTGTLIWQQKQLRGHGLTAPIITENSVIVGSLDGDLYFLDKADGSITSKYHLTSAAITSLRKTGQRFIAYSAGSGALISVEL